MKWPELRTTEDTSIKSATPESIIEAHGVSLEEDLRFLLGVALNIEQRTDKWQDRTAKGLQLALTMNQQAGERVDQRQLCAAILAHDIGMGFLPFEVLNKAGRLNARERKSMQTHIKTAADLVHRMRGWDEARDMILSHHERVDGSGYPNQRVEDEISDGAKILAIVDTFTAQGSTNTMHGVMEIHRHSGTQFSEAWVMHFDSAIKSIRDAQ